MSDTVWWLWHLWSRPEPPPDPLHERAAQTVMQARRALEESKRRRLASRQARDRASREAQERDRRDREERTDTLEDTWGSR